MTIRLLTHETEHALFATAAAGPGTEVKDPPSPATSPPTRTR